jgi:hypothetical protein
MLPIPGCAEILPARSSVSDDEPRREDDVPGAGRVEGEHVRASIGRLGVRMEKARGEEAFSILYGCQFHRVYGLGRVYTVVVLLCV